MTKEQFLEILDRKFIAYKLEDEIVNIDNQGNVDLESLTTLPEGIQFNNQGYVDLESLTTLPEGIQFNNQGNVYLRSLTTLPEGIQFNNQGNVYLQSLTTLPEGIQFNNQGYVDLESLRDKSIITVDRSSMKIINKKQKGDFVIYYAEYLGMVNLKDKKRWVANRGEYFAHGNDIKKAIADVNFKYMQSEMDIESIVNSIKEKGYFEMNDYRLVTGACEAGCIDFLSSKNVTVDKMPISDVVKLTNGAYGFDSIQRYFGDYLKK